VTLYAVFERADEIAPVAVAERFSWFAALLPPVYALVHGLWLGLILYIAALFVLVFGAAFIGGEAAGWLYVLFALLIGFEASAFRRRALRHRGWHEAGEIVAGAPDLALVSFLQSRSAA
jgi:hypothetical protein